MYPIWSYEILLIRINLAISEHSSAAFPFPPHSQVAFSKNRDLRVQNNEVETALPSFHSPCSWLATISHALLFSTEPSIWGRIRRERGKGGRGKSWPFFFFPCMSLFRKTGKEGTWHLSWRISYSCHFRVSLDLEGNVASLNHIKARIYQSALKHMLTVKHMPKCFAELGPMLVKGAID